MFDVRRLRALRELADRGTIAAAAEALTVTPSAVSQQLAALEREVGQPLLEPDGRSVRLTPAARILLDHVDSLFAQIEALDADLAAHASLPRGPVRIASFPSAIIGIVIPALGRLRESAPDVRPVVTEAEAPEAIAGLARGEFDVVLSMECQEAPGHRDTRFARLDLGRDPLDVALPDDHPAAAAGAVRLADLRDDVWVGPPVGWSCDQVATAGCQAAGFTPRVEHRSSDWSAVMAMVEAGLGVALIPRLAQVTPRPGVLLRPVAGEPPARHLLAACRRGAERAPAVAAVLEAVALTSTRLGDVPSPA